MSELKRVVEDDHALGVDDVGDGFLGGGQVEVLLPRLVQALVGVATVAEGADGVDVEGVLPLADDGLLGLDLGLLGLLVDLARVVAESLVEERGLLGRGEVDEPTLRLAGPLWREHLLLEGVANHLELVQLGGEVLAPPRPLHLALALFAWSVVVAGGARRFVDDRVGLESVTQHDVGVHGGDVEMVDEGRVLAQRVVAELDEHGGDLGLDLVVVCDVLELMLALLGDAELERVVEVVDEL